MGAPETERQSFRQDSRELEKVVGARNCIVKRSGTTGCRLTGMGAGHSRFEVRGIEGKGNGVIALQGISAGEVLLEEPVLLNTMPSEHPIWFAVAFFVFSHRSKTARVSEGVERSYHENQTIRGESMAPFRGRAA